MKHYTGTKTIMAMPMAKSEAEQKLNRSFEYVEEQEGYYIEYPDGYRSWCPKSVFEEAYRPSETRLDRLRLEKEQLRENLLKATAFITSEDFRSLPASAAEKLNKQVAAMADYLMILSSRIEDSKKEERDRETQQASKNLQQALVGMTVVSAGRCDDCKNEPADCKKLILADGTHICLK